MTNLYPKILEFTHKGKRHKFNVLTNMTDGQLKDAFESWSFRAKTITVDLFCDYINEKESGHECYNAQ